MEANGVSDGGHTASLLVIETLFGWVSDSESFVEALNRSRAKPASPARVGAGAGGVVSG